MTTIGNLMRDQSVTNESTDLQPQFTDNVQAPTQTLRDSVEKALKNYFDHLDGQAVTDVYKMVLSEIEAPLLECVMSYTKGNQTNNPYI